jgi:hypothetical protein
VQAGEQAGSCRIALAGRPPPSQRTWQWGGCSSRPMRSSSWEGISLNTDEAGRQAGGKACT